MKQYNTLRKAMLLVGLVCILCFLLQTTLRAEESVGLPTIEELTKGKVKVGDFVTKENVDSVKDYLSVCVYELVKQGMVLKIGATPAPDSTVPAFFKEATKRNLEEYGQPVIDENATIYTKDGKTWPGGLPFPKPSNVLEVVANAKYGHGLDDFCAYQDSWFVNKQGKVYKTQHMEVDWVWTNGRLKVDPLGVVPGFEEELERNLPVLTEPFDLKGLGQLSIKHWDDAKNSDEGFVYLPAFKRVVRISATTYQDNVGGSDVTWGDPNGLREPFSYWEFRLIGKKAMLATSPFNEPDTLRANRSVESSKEFTEGKKFPKVTWAVTLLDIVEAVPKIKHIYSKKVLYIRSPENWIIYSPITIVDIYDAQNKLWKGNVNYPHRTELKGEPISVGGPMSMWDLQSGHTTHFFGVFDLNKGYQPKNFDIKALIAKGR